MRTEPLIELTAYDIWDDADCGCETCQTPWGTEPLLVSAPAIAGFSV